MQPGTTADGVGDFTTLLTTVNPQLTVDGYPQAWTKYAVSLTGLATTNVAGVHRLPLPRDRRRPVR